MHFIMGFFIDILDYVKFIMPQLAESQWHMVFVKCVCMCVCVMCVCVCVIL